MKILLMSRQGDGADLAIDAKRDGHECRVWIKDPKARSETFEGMVEKVDDWKPHLEWADLVLFDANHLSEEHAIAKKVKPCWGGSSEGEKMEQDRDFAHGLMEKAGMERFETETFKTIEEAQRHVKKHQVLHVVKIVGGDAGSEDVLISELETGEDVIALMDRYADSGKKYDEVEVEERIRGIEVGCAGYFNGKEFIGPIELNWQFKEVASGRPGSDRGLGFLVGETGTVIKYVTQQNGFFKKTLGKFMDHLRKIDYRGEIDIGTMTNETGVYPIEFTPRFGYPDLYIRRALAGQSQFDLFLSGAKGEKTNFKTLPGWALGYLLMSPGFPFKESVALRSAGIPVFGYNDKNPDQHLMEVKKGKRGLEITKGDGYVAVVTGRGDTIEMAQRNAYWQIHPVNEKRLYVPKAFVRSDIGDRVIVQQEEILELGIMTEQEWSGA